MAALGVRRLGNQSCHTDNYLLPTLGMEGTGGREFAARYRVKPLGNSPRSTVLYAKRNDLGLRPNTTRRLLGPHRAIGSQDER